MAQANRASKLDPYRDEILGMRLSAKRTLAEIITHLATSYGVKVSSSTLSEYIKQHTASMPPPAPDTPSVSPEEQDFLAQAEIFAELQGSALHLRTQNDTVLNRLADLVEAIQAMNREGDERHQQLSARLHHLGQAVPSDGNPAPLLDALKQEQQSLFEQMRREAGDNTPNSVIKGIWKRALVVTGIGWGVGLVLGWKWIAQLSDLVWGMF